MPKFIIGIGFTLLCVLYAIVIIAAVAAAAGLTNWALVRIP